MTEAEWLVASDPQTMLDVLEMKGGDRKLRLFIVACCRRLWPHMIHQSSRRVIELLELAADGGLDEGELKTAAQAANEYTDSPEARISESRCGAAFTAANAVQDYPGERLIWVALRTVQSAGDTLYWLGRETKNASGETCVTMDESEGDNARESEESVQAVMIRDIFPFRPISFLPEWRTSTVLALAQQMYDSRDFSAMPILADALMDASCDNEAILTHCRGPGPHVRGCFVIDLLTVGSEMTEAKFFAQEKAGNELH